MSVLTEEQHATIHAIQILAHVVEKLNVVSIDAGNVQCKLLKQIETYVDSLAEAKKQTDNTTH